MGGENSGEDASSATPNWLIPAWAGKTWDRHRGLPPRPGSSPRGRGKPTEHQVSLTAPWAHPRVGGENSRSSRTFVSWLGSSPRGRGKLTRVGDARHVSRLIPAWAGKTIMMICSRYPRKAHPRVGGENDGHCRSGVADGGSSPRGRGKRSPGGARRRLRLAHPRVGGENSLLAGAYRGESGSSPRGRGKREDGSGAVSLTRLIPAWAGKTSPTRSGHLPAAAHPRVGGENCFVPRLGIEPSGSSPRGRGKPQLDAAGFALMGLIPAWAGKTHSLTYLAITLPAHPRVGGENVCEGEATGQGGGSSPRGRGKQTGNTLVGVGYGLIPAWAGKTWWFTFRCSV